MLEIFSPTSPVLALACLAFALLTACVIGRFSGQPLEHARYQTIDGLRGYLAFFVFLHHASIWFYHLRGNGWDVPPSNLFTHFGQSGVALFFMITAFLFVTKLLDSRKNGIDWKHLYLSRIFRLVPLYLFAMFLLFTLVANISDWQMRESIGKLVSEVSRWLLFTVGGGPDINGVANTSIIMAGVTWSLPYEWLFYFCLPILALLLGIVPPYLYIIFGLTLFGLMIYDWHPDMSVVRCFWGGVAAAFLVRVAKIRAFALTPWGSLLASAIIFYVVTNFPQVYISKAQALLSVAFVLIASGSNLFGLLTLRVSRTLGEMAYSIYLLHGVLLFVLFHNILGFEYSQSLSPMAHWLTLFGASILLICVSFVTYTFIEKPCMKLAEKCRFKPKASSRVSI